MDAQIGVTSQKILFRWTKDGVLSAVSPAPTYAVLAPDGTSIAAGTLTAEATTRYPYALTDELTTANGVGAYEVIATTTDPDVDNATFREIVYVSVSGGGGATAVEIRQEMDASSTKLALLNSSPITVVSGTDAANGTITIRKGDAYTANTGMIEVIHNITNFDLTDGSVTDIKMVIRRVDELKKKTPANTTTPVTADVGSLVPKTAFFALSATETDKLLTSTPDGYKLLASCLVDGDPYTWAEYDVVVEVDGR